MKRFLQANLIVLGVSTAVALLVWLIDSHPSVGVGLGLLTLYGYIVGLVMLGIR